MMGARTARGFVGLKNAGATCYMNSVLQQLYMVHPIRLGILSAHGAATDSNDDFNGEDKNENEVFIENYNYYLTNIYKYSYKHLSKIIKYIYKYSIYFN